MRRVLLALVLTFPAGSVFADAAHDALAEITKCADIQDSAERLKCFDAAMPRARGALAVPVPEAATKSGFLEWFGFSRPQPTTKNEDFGKSPPETVPGEINEIAANVLEFARTPRGKSVFILENGQVWRQLDSDGTVLADPPQGKTMKVLIERGVFGSYNLTIEGRNGLIKVTRLK
jgi:hypothetical protein